MSRYDICARCHKPAKGFARINGKRYCHGDKRPSCYELQSHDDALAMSKSLSRRWLGVFR